MRMSLALVVALGICQASLAAEPDAGSQEAFDQLLTKVQTDPGGSSEADVQRLLRLGQDLGRCYTTSLAVKGYLAHHFQPSAALLKMAAENAFLAGDHRSAATRYKRYLVSAPAGDEASAAAARLYIILIDFLGADDDAYQFMTQHGERLRQSAAARKFDGWYLGQALARKDYVAWANALQRVFAEGMPLEQERLYFWDYLDSLMREVSRAESAQYDALPALKKIIPRLRDNRRRTLKYGLYLANLEFHAGSAGKDEVALKLAFKPVVDAATAWLQTEATADTLQEIVVVFAGGHGRFFNEGEWRRQEDQKRAWFVDAFEKLSDADRETLMGWEIGSNRYAAVYVASAEQWTQLALKHAALFAKAEAARHVPFACKGLDLETIKRQAQVLAGVPSRSAAVAKALAEDDLERCGEHLARKESWHLGFGEPYELLGRTVWPVWRERHTEGDKKPSDDVYGQALVAIGSRHVARTPIALFDPEACKAYIRAAWRYGTTGEDKKRIVPHLRSLDWVPFPDDPRNQTSRRDIFKDAYADFKRWADQIRKDAKQKDSTVKPETLDQIAPIEEAFRAAMDEKTTDPAKAPDDLSRRLAMALVAERKRDAKQFVALAGEIYPAVREWDARKVPFGQAVFDYLTREHANLDTFGFQLEVLADQLARYNPNGSNERIESFVHNLVHQRRNWSWWRIPRSDQKQAEQVAAVFEKALKDQLAKGQFWPDLFNWFRGTRTGDHWSNKDLGADVFEAVITKRLLHNGATRAPGHHGSATCVYMALVRNECPSLNEKHPVESWFDDMFVEEAVQTGFLDRKYWDYGRDEKKKVVNAAARILAGYGRLPFGYNGEAVVYDRADFWDWQARALGADEAERDAMITAVEGAYGKGRFDTYAMGRAYFSVGADMKTDEGRQAFFGRLGQYLDRAQQAPARLSPPYLGALASLEDPAKMSRQELDTLVGIFPFCCPAHWTERWHFETLATTVSRALVAQHRQNELYALAPFLWKIAADTRSTDLQRALAGSARDLLADGHHDLALVLGSVGLDVVRADLPEDARTSLVAVRTKALSNIGGVIPVKRSDPRYPVFASQAAYLTGRYQTAWEQYLANRRNVLSLYKDLDPAFCIWLIDKNVEAGDFDAGEELARLMIQWFDAVTDGFEPEVRARLLIAYGDIALARKEYPKARALYENIAVAKEFEGTRAQHDAQLRAADVDRQTRRYDQAIERLEKLSRQPDKYLQTESFHLLARVKYDQEEYKEAIDYLAQVFARAPGHAEARILEGKVQLKMKKLEEPLEIQVGMVTEKRYIVPGKPLKVSLQDQNLSVVGKSTSIEIRAWSESGDEEFFNLIPFGDSKTKFRGELATALAPVQKGDHVLQVLGKDRVFYDYADAFKKDHKITTAEPSSLAVRTDAELLVSSGKILSKEDREAQALEEFIRRKMELTRPEAPSVALSTLRPSNQIKPGNKINVRVVDPDRSETSGADTIVIRVTSSSGDKINAFALAETGTHTGVYEGAVPTESGQAMAYASDSEDGKEPNFVISAADYPAWVGLADNLRPKLFSVDLNDNVPLGTMKLRAAEPGRKLKTFRVQTSLNGRDFQTIAAWPAAYEPWDGSMRVQVAHFADKRPPVAIKDFDDYLEIGRVRYGAKVAVGKPDALAAKWDANLGGYAQQAGIPSEGDPWFIARFSAAFTQDRRKVRTFELDPKDRTEGIRYLLAVDGVTDRAGTLQVKRSLGKGVHQIDVYVCAKRSAGPDFQVLCDTDEPPYMIPCPAEMFDVEQHPEIREAVAVPLAQIKADEPGEAFDIAFAEGTQARVVRLVLDDFETDAPAINKIALQDRNGQTVLPTKEDFLKLRENDVLEIVPGDRVTITYEDPRVITRGKEQHEAFLTATYTNAQVSPCFVEYTIDGGGNRRARYIAMRRFKPGDKINVFVNDPDCDVSDKLDVVTFTAITSEGQAVELQALETEEHSGVFLGGLFPVEGKSTRSSEIQVKPGDDVILNYVDQENTDPGISWDRTSVVEQVWFAPPELRVYNVESLPLEETKAPAEKPEKGEQPDAATEHVPVRRNLVAMWPEKPELDEPATMVIGGPLLVEVLFPAIAQSPESKATLYAQTSSGRAAHGAEPKEEFDVNVPGTIKLETRPSNAPRLDPPPGYGSVVVRVNPYALDALDDGRFTFAVPIELGKAPEETLAFVDPTDKTAPKPVLAINGGDDIFIGLKYEDEAGQSHWVTKRVVLDADIFFDAMDRRYLEPVDGLFVGENVYFRVIDATRDTTDDKDAVEVVLKSTSGAAKSLSLVETFSHSGVFKGLVKVVYKEDTAEVDQMGTLPVEYGDSIVALYTRPDSDRPPHEQAVLVFKGSDGDVLPFTKRFRDPALAVQTQFTVAEAYFELAKRHRELGKDSLDQDKKEEGEKLLSLARREIAQGKKLLEEALRDFPETESRAQADFLLANLALEFANDAVNADIRKKQYLEAVSRFSDIVATFPDSPYAPEAQYKKALVFEKMGEIDSACEEYVKLSYRYPESERVAETIARLGQYFLTKGKAMKEAAAEAEADDPVEAEKIRMQSREMFTTAAEVFGRLGVRFPSHHLAGKTSVLSAQCYMQAEEYAKAVKVFDRVITEPEMDKDLVAEAMYWSGDCYMRMEEKDSLVNAYRMFKKLTWDYPATKWAKFARGRLTDERLARIDAG